MQSVLQRAVADPELRTRASVVVSLGAHVQDAPQAKAMLEQIARSDANVQVKQAAAEVLHRRE